MTGREEIEKRIVDLEARAAREESYAAETKAEVERALDHASDFRRLARELRELLDETKIELVSLRFNVKGVPVSVVVPAGESAGVAVAQARIAAGVPASEFAYEWEVRDARGFRLMVAVETWTAADLAGIPSPVFVNPRPGVGG